MRTAIKIFLNLSKISKIYLEESEGKIKILELIASFICKYLQDFPKLEGAILALLRALGRKHFNKVNLNENIYEYIM